MGITWKSRRRRCDTEIANRWRTESTCGRYSITESRPKLSGLAKVFYAQWNDNDSLAAFPIWMIISTHKKLQPAKDACERHAKARLEKRR